MFCPNCGGAEQNPDTFCRKCGNFLPDFESLQKKKVTPGQHLVANGVLTGMTAVVSAALAIMLYATFLGRDDTPMLIYVTAGFLTAMFFWQVQVIWRTILLKKSLPARGNDTARPDIAKQPLFRPAEASNFLPEADPEAFIPASVTEGTTRSLAEKLPRRSAKSEH